MHQHSHNRGSKGEERKSLKKIPKDTVAENFPSVGKETATQVQEAQSPKQDKPKAKYPKTHINQTNES